MQRFFSRMLLTGSSAIVIALATPAWAQTAPQDAPAPQAEPSAESGPITDIVVTARRRAESLQTTPVTITAFSGETLAAKGIVDVTRLAQTTPGISFDTFPKAAPRLFFRGVGSANQGGGGDPSSVPFLDGVYLARGPMLGGIDFYDMERVEVLKGPQGTLWGKNVVAGAANFITNKPVDDLEATAQFTAGEYGQLNGNLMINVPVATGVAMRAVFGAVTNSGFRHTSQGQPLDNDNMKSVRLLFRADLTSNTRLLLTGDLSKLDLADGSHFNIFNQPFTPGVGYTELDDPRIEDPDFKGYTLDKTGGARAELSTDALGFANWTTVAAWRTLDYDTGTDFDGRTAAANAAAGVLVSGVQVLAREWANSYSLESRLTSNGSGPVKWVLGLYYNRDEIHRERESQTTFPPKTFNRFIGDSKNDSYAAFGEVEYKFDFGLSLFAGGRYTKEKKAYASRRIQGPITAPIIAYDTADSPGFFNAGVFTYRVGTDFQVSRNVFLFATLSTGFKSGAFQEQPATADLARIATKPERTTNYEVGIKSEFFDHRFRANISVFDMEYRDFQTVKNVPDLTVGPTATRLVIDTGNARIRGIETEFVIAPVDWFDTTIRYSYIDPRFTKFSQTQQFNADGSATRINGAGNRLSRAYNHALVIDAGLQSSKSAAWGWVRGAVTMDYQSDIYDNDINDFFDHRRPRTLWDASLTYNINDRWSAEIWAHNITNATYRTYSNFNTGSRYEIVMYGPPRQIGFTLRAAFR